MKVCQLCAVDFTLKNFLLPLIDGMKSNGWEVISVCSDGAAVAELRQQGYKIKTLPIDRSMNLIRHIISIWRLIRLFSHEKFDIVHVHTPVAALLGRVAARIVRTPLVVYTAHGFYFHDEMPQWKRRIHIALERFAGYFTDLLFTQSAEDAVTATKENIVHHERIFSIGNGIDVSRFDPAKIGRQIGLRRSLGIPVDAFVVGMIGRQVKEKGIVEFLKAAMLLTERGEFYYFVLIGDRLKSDHAIGVEEAISEAKSVLADRLILLGLREDIPELLAVMDLFCLPSWREGMPRTILEAMMMGKPVVSTDIRGSREEVLPEETGLLVPVRSAERLASAIQRCADNKLWAEQLGAAGRRRALELYDERKVVSFQIEKIKNFAKQSGLTQ